MSIKYTGADKARQAREVLAEALAALQEDPNVPKEVMAVATHIAQAIGALFESEQASSEPDGKAGVRNALGSLSQTMALLQDLRASHRGITVATEVLARVMSILYPLTTVPSRILPPHREGATRPSSPATPAVAPQTQAEEPPVDIEANIGATTESNFYVGFSGEVAEGGVFLSTYEVLPSNTRVRVLVTLPGGFEFKTLGRVRFVRDPLDLAAESEPGMGVQFENLEAQARELILRFIRKRPPIFFDE